MRTWRHLGAVIQHYAFVFFAIDAMYIPLVEEGSLSSRFGREYLDLRRNVPCPKPWTQETDTGPRG
jgi:protein-S-isoprenylcysteine O-methyltransferase Ste14